MMRLLPNCSLSKVFHAAVLAVALCAAPASHAGVLNFESPVASNLVFDGDVIKQGKYFVEGIGNGFVGTIDNNEACFNVQCPVNNASHYYSALGDGYLGFGMLDHSGFTLSSIDASFLGASSEGYPSIAALLYIAAYDASGFVDEIYLALSGPTNGSFNFASYDLSGFGGGQQFTDVLVASFACNDAGDCNRETNQAQFAIDNIVTLGASDVPEPATFALFGLGLLGLAHARRRAA
jgi:hypothetical protein